MFGGWSAGKAITVTCANLSDPNTFRNCDHSAARHSLPSQLQGGGQLPAAARSDRSATSIVSNAGSLLGSNVQDRSLAVNLGRSGEPVSGRPDAGGHRATRHAGEPVPGALEPDGHQRPKGVQSWKHAVRAGRGHLQPVQQQPRAHGESELRVVSGTAVEGPPGTPDAAHGPDQFLANECSSFRTDTRGSGVLSDLPYWPYGLKTSWGGSFRTRLIR